jgi:two-component system CheB/CheR fusion protein
MVAGIGASAGGLEALLVFSTPPPRDAGVAYVFVVPLSPEHASRMPDLLQRWTAPVRAVTETTTRRRSLRAHPASSTYTIHS